MPRRCTQHDHATAGVLETRVCVAQLRDQVRAQVIEIAISKTNNPDALLVVKRGGDLDHGAGTDARSCVTLKSAMSACLVSSQYSAVRQGLFITTRPLLFR